MTDRLYILFDLVRRLRPDLSFSEAVSLTNTLYETISEAGNRDVLATITRPPGGTNQQL